MRDHHVQEQVYLSRFIEWNQKLNKRFTSTKGRKYQIVSMQAKTLSQSLNFLSRYQLLALMNDLIQKDPENTPVEDRNIMYFVNHYITHYVTSPEQPHRFRRHIYDHEIDSDVDMEGHTKKPRHPRHVPRAEIVGIFGAQAEWILAEQSLRQSSKRIVDINKWYSFCLEVKAARISAMKDRKRKVPKSRPIQRWGLPDGVDSDADDETPDMDLSVFGEPPGGWAKKLKNARKGTLANKEKFKVSYSLRLGPCSLIIFTKEEESTGMKMCPLIHYKPMLT